MEGAFAAGLTPSHAPTPGGSPIDLETRLREAHRRATIITYAVMATLAVYVIAVELIHRTSDVTVAQSFPEVVRYVLYGVAISMVFLTQIVRALFLRGIKRGDLDTALARLNVSSVVTGVLAETPALMGLVMFIVWGQYSDFYILFFVSLYLTVRHFPRYGTWESVAGFVQTGSES